MEQPTRELALITGASSGIGAALARELAGRGYDLILTARRTERLQALKDQILQAAPGRAIEIVSEDLAAPEGASSLIRQVEALTQAMNRPVGFLANNAGFGVHGPFLDNGADRIDQMLRLNMEVLTKLSWHFGRAMRQRGRGRVLQVSSVGAFQPTPFYAAYAATKAYVLFLSEALNRELRASGVTVTTLCPGMTDTEFHAVAEHPKTGLVAMTSMSAASVARAAVRGALAGKAVVTPGWLNWLMGLAIKLVPRSLATAGAGLLMRD